MLKVPLWARLLAIALAVAAIAWLNDRYVVQPAVARNDKAWSDKWHQRDLADSKAKADYDAEQRGKERAAQAALDQLQAESEKELALAQSRAAAARGESQRLRKGISDAIAQLQQQRGESTGAQPVIPAGASSALLLSDLFGELDEAATNYAGEADRARRAGLNCERAYDEVRKVINDEATRR